MQHGVTPESPKASATEVTAATTEVTEAFPIAIKNAAPWPIAPTRKYHIGERQRKSPVDSNAPGRELPAYFFSDYIIPHLGEDFQRASLASTKIYTNLPLQFLAAFLQVQLEENPIYFPGMCCDKHTSAREHMKGHPAFEAGSLRLDNWQALGFSSEQDYSNLLDTSMLFFVNHCSHYCEAYRIFDQDLSSTSFDEFNCSLDADIFENLRKLICEIDALKTRVLYPGLFENVPLLGQWISASVRADLQKAEKKLTDYILAHREELRKILNKKTRTFSVSGLEFRGYKGPIDEGLLVQIQMHSKVTMAQILTVAEREQVTDIVMIPYGFGVFLAGLREEQKEEVQKKILQGMQEALRDYTGSAVILRYCGPENWFNQIKVNHPKIAFVHEVGSDAYTVANRIQDQGNDGVVSPFCDKRCKSMLINAGDDDWKGLKVKKNRPGQCAPNHNLYMLTSDELFANLTTLRDYSIPNLNKLFNLEQHIHYIPDGLPPAVTTAIQARKISDHDIDAVSVMPNSSEHSEASTSQASQELTVQQSQATITATAALIAKRKNHCFYTPVNTSQEDCINFVSSKLDLTGVQENIKAIFEYKNKRGFTSLRIECGSQEDVTQIMKNNKHLEEYFSLGSDPLFMQFNEDSPKRYALIIWSKNIDESLLYDDFHNKLVAVVPTGNSGLSLPFYAKNAETVPTGQVLESWWDGVLKQIGDAYKPGFSWNPMATTSKHLIHAHIVSAMRNKTIGGILRGIGVNDFQEALMLVYMALENTTSDLARQIERHFEYYGALGLNQLSTARARAKKEINVPYTGTNLEEVFTKNYQVLLREIHPPQNRPDPHSASQAIPV